MSGELQRVTTGRAESPVTIDEAIRDSPGVEHLADFAGGWDRVPFSTDWPNRDFDSPAVVNESEPRGHRPNVRSGNALEAFNR